MDNKGEIARLTAEIAARSGDAALYFERGRLHYKAGDFPSALNDFNEGLTFDAENTEAQQYVRMINEILDYRYTDIYNP